MVPDLLVKIVVKDPEPWRVAQTRTTIFTAVWLQAVNRDQPTDPSCLVRVAT
jgi:hypothetical protein